LNIFYKLPRQLCCIALLLGAAMLPALAASPPTAKTIEHLITFIQNSGCVFVRNGIKHDARQAADHIRKKYGYGKDKIETPEQFIEYAATRSSVSGKPYLVKCGNDDAQASADWLRKELFRYKEKTSSEMGK
jgi:hypothetical protein